MYEDYLTFEDLLNIPLEDEPIPLAMGICLPSKKHIEDLAQLLADELGKCLKT